MGYWPRPNSRVTRGHLASQSGGKRRVPVAPPDFGGLALCQGWQQTVYDERSRKR
jgi:hypothetical protein